jgi:signal peptidase I
VPTELLPALISVLFAVPAVVAGDSMRPTLRPGDRLLVDRFTLRLRPPRRGELVVALPKLRPELWIVKRVVGLPGESVELRGDLLSINGHPLAEPYLANGAAQIGRFSWQLGRSEYLLLGDNRAESDDSRLYGPFPRCRLRGPVRPYHRNG